MRLLHWSSLARMPPKQSRCNCKHHQHQRMLAGHGARDEDELTRALQEPELEVALQLPIAYPDHPERDSLDGHLPGSSHGTGNPPPPPAPPAASGVSNKPSGSGFTKGPNAKNKKHKKLKNEADEGPPSGGDAADKDKKKDNHEKSGKDKDMETGGGYRPKTEPYTYLWVVMSGMYGKLVVLLMLAFCLTEVLDNQVLPLTFQGIFLMYLYVGSIVAIMCIYVTVIADNCPSITASKENLTKNGDPEAGSITSFGTLKRAHISRSKTSRTSFYLRVGALVFGLGTLIFNGLEIAMHSTMKGECVEDIVFAHPILQALFTFLQMHFLFVNSEVIVEKFGQVARFGFMHLVATNVAIWIRMVVWESATDSIEVMYSDMPLAEVPPHAEQVLRLYSCFQNNSLGRLWTDAQPYLFPFLVEYRSSRALATLDTRPLAIIQTSSVANEEKRRTKGGGRGGGGGGGRGGGGGGGGGGSGVAPKSGRGEGEGRGRERGRGRGDKKKREGEGGKDNRSKRGWLAGIHTCVCISARNVHMCTYLYIYILIVLTYIYVHKAHVDICIPYIYMQHNYCI
ncbi:uncharacterized protein LOC122254176 isoform X2 [Penaeus japonicus]|uniref:uncharacterized protein LOC122254176 isoform X2 n=1 Tax=Penaeus japonicus TaxID=27405 RepID=UPI001C714EE6|nr:uncharacterized protein LOC122254176 isoform X2 [Penaeus japonicus]